MTDRPRRPRAPRCAWPLLVAAVLPLGALAQGLRQPGRPGLTAPAPALLPAPAAAPSGNQSADYIVAVVNTEPITNHEVQQAAARLEAQLQRAGGAMPPREVLLREVLERLISEKAQLQLAAETGIKIDDAAVDQAELTIARQNQLSVDELRRQLRRDGIDPQQFRADLRKQLTLTRLREREVAARVQVTEADVDAFLREQAENAANAGSALINLAQILVEVPETAGAAKVEELRQKAEDLARKARTGADFAALARESSDAPDAKRTGGELGLRPTDRYPELFVQATANANPGAVIGPVRSGAGWHVLKVLEKRQPSAADMTVVQTHARHILLRPGPRLTEAQARAQLADLRSRIVRGQADFATLAKEYSQDGSAREGGDLGWANPGQFVPEFEEALDRLQPGEISEPVISRFGVHLIQLLERREKKLSPQEQREVARNLAREKKLDEDYANWARDVRSRAYVELREPPQ